MNKRQLISAIAKKTEIPKSDIELVIDQYHETITNELASGRRVQLNKFGTYELIAIKNRKFKNPKTDEEIELKATIKPKFRYSSIVKEKIQNSTKIKRRIENQ